VRIFLGSGLAGSDIFMSVNGLSLGLVGPDEQRLIVGFKRRGAS
jgi:hypothetical protein